MSLSIDQFASQALFHAPEGILLLDPKGICMFINAKAQEMLSVSDPTMAVGKHVHDIVHPSGDFADHSRQACPLETYLSTTSSVFGKTDVFRTKTMEAYWVEYSFYPVSAFKTEDAFFKLTFINAELASSGKEDYLKARSKYKIIFDASHDWKFIVSDTGIIEEANASALKYFRKDVIGSMFFSLFLTSEQTVLKEIWEHRFSATIRLVPFSFAPHNGGECHTELTIIPNVFPKKSVIVLRDITSKVMLQRQHDQFLAVASHELKTPLAVIKAFIQLLEVQIKEIPNPKIHRYARQIEEKTDLLTALVSDIVDSIRLGSDKLKFSDEQINFDEVVKTIVEEIQGKTSTHALKMSGQSKAMVCVDPQRLRQVLENLILNGVKSSGRKEEIFIRLSKDLDWVRVEIEDQGRGLSKKDQQNVFLPFFRNKAVVNPHAETGLGLYLAQRIITNYKGSLEVSSAYGKGSIFTFKLPTLETTF